MGVSCGARAVPLSVGSGARDYASAVESASDGQG